MNFTWSAFFGITIILMTVGPGFAQDLLEQGLAAPKAKNHERAVELLGQFVQKSPDHPEAWRVRTQFLVALGCHQPCGI